MSANGEKLTANVEQAVAAGELLESAATNIRALLAEAPSVLYRRAINELIAAKEWPELKIQIDAFKAALKKLGQYEVREYEMDTKDQPKYGLGSGLSGRRYVRTVKKNEKADLFVSFVGAPKLSSEEVAELGNKPMLIVESRSGENLYGLFQDKLVVAAVVSRFQFPAPAPEKPHTPDEWFVKRYQILTPDDVKILPKAE